MMATLWFVVTHDDYIDDSLHDQHFTKWSHLNFRMIYFFNQFIIENCPMESWTILMALCKTVVCPLLMQWRWHSLVQSYWYHFLQLPLNTISVIICHCWFYQWCIICGIGMLYQPLSSHLIHADGLSQHPGYSCTESLHDANFVTESHHDTNFAITSSTMVLLVMTKLASWQLLVFSLLAYCWLDS